jgi:hypothetical protein
MRGVRRVVDSMTTHHPRAQGPFDLEAINTHCLEVWNVTPRVHHSFVQFGGVEVRRFRV